VQLGPGKPVLRIHEVLQDGPRWKRDIQRGNRVGPWLPARWEAIDRQRWARRTPCLYFVSADDEVVRYVGISKRTLRERWREAVALHHDSTRDDRRELAERQIFHYPCWPHIEVESADRPDSWFEVRVIHEDELERLLPELGQPLTELMQPSSADQLLVQRVESWLRSRRAELSLWNEN
jgi:hypothetical protein